MSPGGVPDNCTLKDAKYPQCPWHFDEAILMWGFYILIFPFFIDGWPVQSLTTQTLEKNCWIMCFLSNACFWFKTISDKDLIKSVKDSVREFSEKKNLKLESYSQVLLWGFTENGNFSRTELSAVNSWIDQNGLVGKRYGEAKGRLMQFNISTVLGKQSGMLVMNAIPMHHLTNSTT